jgi:hypothetical protein
MLSNVLSRYWWMTLLRGVAWILLGWPSSLSLASLS